jgi:hypothetical protein
VHVWGAPLCAVLLWIGWFLGGVATYAVGRYFGRPMVERLVRPATIAKYETWARSSVALAPILLVQLALPSDAAGYIFGIVRCRVGIFLAALAVAEVPYALGAVYLGLSFLERDLPALLGLGLAGLALSAWAITRLHRRPERAKAMPCGRLRSLSAAFHDFLRWAVASSFHVSPSRLRTRRDRRLRHAPRGDLDRIGGPAAADGVHRTGPGRADRRE